MKTKYDQICVISYQDRITVFYAFHAFDNDCSITAVLKAATESLQGKQVDLGSCMTTITLMKQQLQEMNGDYWHNFLFPKIMKLGEELNVDIAKPRQQHVILLQHLIPGFVPAAHVTDEEVAKVLLTKYQSLCPSTLP